MVDIVSRLKLLEREESLLKKREKIDEELKKVSKQIKEIEYQQKVKNIEDTILILDDHSINIKDVIKEIQNGRFDHLKKQPVKDSEVSENATSGKEQQAYTAWGSDHARSAGSVNN